MYLNYPEEYERIITNPLTELNTLRRLYSDITIDEIDNVNFILFFIISIILLILLII